jgi:hypothetical protein
MAVPKKAPAKKTAPAKGKQVEVSKSDMVKKYAKFNKTIKRTGKETAPAGFVKDEEVIKLLGLKPGSGQTAKARLTSVKFVKVNDSEVLKFRFVIQSGKGKGTPVGTDIWFDADDEERTEKSLKEVIFMLQKLGYDTSEELDMSKLCDLADDLSEEKPYCVIYVNCYKGKSGKSKGVVKYGVRVNSSYDPESDEEVDSDEEDEEEDEDTEEDDDSDDEEEEAPKAKKGAAKKTVKKAEPEEEEEDEDDEEDEDEEEEEEEEPPKKSSSKSATIATKKATTKTASPSKSKKEEPEYEDVEDDEEEEEEVDADDPSTWIGQSAKIKPEGEKKLSVWEITKFDKKKNLLTIKQGKVTKTCSPDDVKDFVE